MERTEWFPHTIDPVYVGPYEDDTGPVYWDGRNWYIITEEEVESGEFNLEIRYYLDKVSLGVWRGLANNPKKGKK